jgi:hypothetical protein
MVQSRARERDIAGYRSRYAIIGRLPTPNGCRYALRQLLVQPLFALPGERFAILAYDLTWQ